MRRFELVDGTSNKFWEVWTKARRSSFGSERSEAKGRRSRRGLRRRRWRAGPEEQKLGPIALSPRGMLPSQLDPILYSELVRDVVLTVDSS